MTNTHSHRHRGPYRDDYWSAVRAALADVNLTLFDFVACEFADGLRLEPVSPTQAAIDVDVKWNETRQQWSATLRRNLFA